MDKITFLTLSLLLVCPNAFAFLKVIQHQVNTIGTGTTLNVGVNPTGSGNLLVAATEIGSTGASRTVTQITDGTTNFTQVSGARATNTTGGTKFATDIWYLPLSNSGKTTITATINASGNKGWGMEVWEVSGFTAPVVDTANVVNCAPGLCPGTQSGGVATGAAVTTANNHGYAEFVVASDQTSNAVSSDPEPGNEFTSGGDIDSNDNAFCSLITAIPNLHTPAWTDAGVTFCSSTAAIMESASVQTSVKNASIHNAALQ